MPTKAIGDLSLDRVIHERARLVILSYLAESRKEVAFTELRDALGFTAGNLSIQLRTLSDAGYVRVDKRFEGRRPFTGAVLTPKGAAALADYLKELEVIVGSLKAAAGRRGK